MLAIRTQKLATVDLTEYLVNDDNGISHWICPEDLDQVVMVVAVEENAVNGLVEVEPRTLEVLSRYGIEYLNLDAAPEWEQTFGDGSNGTVSLSWEEDHWEITGPCTAFNSTYEQSHQDRFATCD